MRLTPEEMTTAIELARHPASGLIAQALLDTHDRAEANAADARRWRAVSRMVQWEQDKDRIVRWIVEGTELDNWEETADRLAAEQERT